MAFNCPATLVAIRVLFVFVLFVGLLVGGRRSASYRIRFAGQVQVGSIACNIPQLSCGLLHLVGSAIAGEAVRKKVHFHRVREFRQAVRRS